MRGRRHNVGFMVAEALVERWGLGRAKDRFKARVAEGRVRSGPPGSGAPEGRVWRCSAPRPT